MLFAILRWYLSKSLIKNHFKQHWCYYKPGFTVSNIKKNRKKLTDVINSTHYGLFTRVFFLWFISSNKISRLFVSIVYHWSPNTWLSQVTLSEKLNHATFKKLCLECPLTFPGQLGTGNHSSPLGVLLSKESSKGKCKCQLAPLPPMKLEMLLPTALQE